MSLYTLKVSAPPFSVIVLGQFLDKKLALKAAEAILPYCVESVFIEEWLVIKNISIPVSPKGKDWRIYGVSPEIIYRKKGTRKLTKKQREAHEACLAQFY